MDRREPLVPSFRGAVLSLVNPGPLPPPVSMERTEIPTERTMALFRTSADPELLLSEAALTLLERFPETALIDEVAGLFLAAIEAAGAALMHLTEFDYLMRLVKLGASQELMERLMKQLVSSGCVVYAERLLEMLGRSFTGDEARVLVESAINGPDEISSAFWASFALRYLGAEEAEQVRAQILQRAEADLERRSGDRLGGF